MGGLCLIIFGAARGFGLLRIKAEKEDFGLDCAASPLDAITEGAIKKENPDHVSRGESERAFCYF